MLTNYQTQWQDCLQIIKDNLQNEEAFKAFFEPCQPLSFENNKLTLGIPSHFVYDQLENQYFDLLKKTLQRVYGVNTFLDYKIYIVKDASVEIPTKQVKIEEPSIPTNLNPNLSLSSFFPGKSNELAYSAALTVTQNQDTMLLIHSLFSVQVVSEKLILRKELV